jgi:hypothetical protein
MNASDPINHFLSRVEDAARMAASGDAVGGYINLLAEVEQLREAGAFADGFGSALEHMWSAALSRFRELHQLHDDCPPGGDEPLSIPPLNLGARAGALALAE